MSNVNPSFYIIEDDEDDDEEDDDYYSEDDEDDESVPVVAENVASVSDKTTSLGVDDDKCCAIQDLMSKDDSEIDGLCCPICMEPWTSQGVHQVWLVFSASIIPQFYVLLIYIVYIGFNFRYVC